GHRETAGQSCKAVNSEKGVPPGRRQSFRKERALRATGPKPTGHRGNVRRETDHKTNAGAITAPETNPETRMSQSSNSKVILVLATAWLLFASCDEQRVFDSYKSVGNAWHRDSIVSFDLPQVDTTKMYNLFVNVRSND